MMQRQSGYELSRRVDRQQREDKFHDMVVTVLEAIQRGSLRQPERLPSFVYTITRRGVVAQIRANIRGRRCVALDEAHALRSQSKSPETAAAETERREKIHLLLATLCARDRELLIRFYLCQELPQQICGEMHLTATQFRLYKSRALARCSEKAAFRDPLTEPFARTHSTKPERIA